MTPSPSPTTHPPPVSLPPSTTSAPHPPPSTVPTIPTLPTQLPAVDPEDLNKWLYKDPQGEIQGEVGAIMGYQTKAPPLSNE